MATNPQPERLKGRVMVVEDYLQFNREAIDAKYEYLDGVARLMSGGSSEHDRISRNMANALESHFQSGPCSVWGSDMQVLVGVKSSGKEHYVYPDATVSCDVADRRRGNALIRSPRLVVEVLSPTTEQVDRGRKLRAYQGCPTIQEIVLINQFLPSVEVYRREDAEGDTWLRLFSGPDATTVTLASVDSEVEMSAIYKGINFDEPLIEDD